MSKHRSNNVFTIVVGGAAGDGIREAGSSLGQLLAKAGFEVFISFDYPSLIRGGHNFSRISFSGDKIFNDHAGIDLLIALNPETMRLRRGELNKDAAIFADEFEKEDTDAFGPNAVCLPMIDYAKTIGAPSVTRTSVALGAVCYLLDLPMEKALAVLAAVFKDKAMEFNIKLAEMGYEYLTNSRFRHWKKIQSSERAASKELIDGNSAFAKGLVAAGLDFYLAYPMTPSTSILHFLAKQQKDFGIKVFQPEDEIAVINMALGIAYAGKRAAIGTSGGGFALMQEAFSLAGMAELPLVAALSQRQGPSIGVATYTGQSELRWAVHSGHGEFPRIVLAPGDAEEAFLAGADALNLAWKYQLPVIVLLDKHLSECAMTSLLDTEKIQIERGKIADPVNNEYKRYALSEDGISPMAFPPTPGAVIKSTSYEHDARGTGTDDAKTVKAMQDKRFLKLNAIRSEFKSRNSVKLYGDIKSKSAIVFWGSTKGAVLEAAKYLKTPAKLLQIVWMEPFDAENVCAALKNAKKIIAVEGNHTGQLASLIREKTGINIEKKILKYDSRPFDPLELAGELNALL